MNMDINEKLNNLIGENLFLLVKRFRDEVRTESKYSEPLISSWKVRDRAYRKFSQYVKTN